MKLELLQIMHFHFVKETMCKRSVINLLLDTHERVFGLFTLLGVRNEHEKETLCVVLCKQLSLAFKSQSLILQYFSASKGNI